MYQDLNTFIDALDRERELARITEPVSPELEICAPASSTR
jgi:3-polyprenyl-4-hydroxybenzoate decarboxylase